MEIKSIYNGEEIDKLLEDQFTDFEKLSFSITKGINVSKDSIFRRKFNIYLKDEYYGEIFIDNGVIESYESYYPIIRAGRISHMYTIHTCDTVDLTDVYPELRGKDFTLTEDMLKHLVVAQLRKSYPMAIWSDPK